MAQADITGRTRILGLIADPVAQARAPAMGRSGSWGWSEGSMSSPAARLAGGGRPGRRIALELAVRGESRDGDRFAMLRGGPVC